MSLPIILFTIVIILFTMLSLKKKILPPPFCNIKKDLTGKVVIITGANKGVGKETAYGLAKMKATVIIASRDPNKSIPVVKELQETTGNSNIEFIRLDLADLSSVKKFTEQFRSKFNRLDVLINNAAIVLYGRDTTKDGFEMQFGTNHLGHFYLTTLLLDLIEKSAPSRIINLSSSIHMDCNRINWDDIMYEKGYFIANVYSQTKLTSNLFTKELQRRLNSKKVKVVSVHPGLVSTNLYRNTEKWYEHAFMKVYCLVIDLFAKNTTEGAQTTLYCAIEDHDKLKAGMYYADLKVAKENKLANDEENWKRMWKLSEDLISKALSK